VIFTVTAAQLWLSAVVLNMGPPFRAPVWRNRGLVAVLVRLGVYHLGLGTP